MCIYYFTHCVDLGCSSRMLLFLSVFLFFSPLSFIPLFLFCVFLHSLLISGVINHRLFGWQCKTAPGAAIHQSHHPPSSQITRKNWHLLLCRGEEEKRETEIGRGKEEARDGERKKKEGERTERKRKTRWWASAGRGGINFLDRQEQLWFTACRGTVRYREVFKTDRWSHTSSLLLLLQTSLCSDEPATAHERRFRLGTKLRYWTISNNMIQGSQNR